MAGDSVYVSEPQPVCVPPVAGHKISNYKPAVTPMLVESGSECFVCDFFVILGSGFRGKSQNQNVAYEGDSKFIFWNVTEMFKNWIYLIKIDFGRSCIIFSGTNYI